jgi:hypothetical protein
MSFDTILAENIPHSVHDQFGFDILLFNTQFSAERLICCAALCYAEQF